MLKNTENLSWGLTKTKVSQAIEANMVQFRTYLGRLPNSMLQRYGTGVSIVNPDIKHHIYNTVLGVSLNQTDPKSFMQEILQPYRQHLLPVLWWTGPAVNSREGKHLEEAGFSPGLELPGLAADIDSVLTKNAASERLGLVIEKVENTQSLQTYMEVFRGFGLTEQVNRPFSWLFEEYALSQGAPWHRYVGFYDGQAVAISELYLGAGVAGIYSVGTASYYRRRGFGRALTLAALTMARKQGYMVAILHSSPSGYPLYISMGFRKYCQMKQYILR